nr:response regulator transcription factor [Tissierella sp.]
MKKSILIVDDDKNFVDSLKYNLSEHNYKLDCISSCKIMMKKIEEKQYDLILLNEAIEGIDGVEMCKVIRKRSTIPIIMLSNNNDEMPKILAFEYGADDYMIKPFNFLELKARIKTIFRRMDYKINSEPKHIFKINNFTIDFLKRNISIEDKDINFTGKEFDLFYVLSSNAGKVFSREELLDAVWGYNHYGDIRTVDVHIRRIREKIETDTEETQYIMTKWGEGYYFNDILIS